MTTNHVDFEVLCALAASGNLTSTERAELNEHAEHCVHCQNRLVEMRQLGTRLFLAHELNIPAKRVPKGMQERFSARAIREGIPLSSPSPGVGFSALGLVTALLVVLLLAAATLKDHPAAKSVAEIGVPDTPHLSQVFSQKVRSSEGVANHPRRARTRRVLNRQVSFPEARGSSSAVFPDLSELQGPPFTFTPYSRTAGMRPYSVSLTIISPEILSSFASPHKAPIPTLDITSDVFRHNAPHLLAVSDHAAFGSVGFRGNFDLASPAAQIFPLLKVDFKTNAFQPGQTRSSQ